MTLFGVSLCSVSLPSIIALSIAVQAGALGFLAHTLSFIRLMKHSVVDPLVIDCRRVSKHQNSCHSQQYSNSLAVEVEELSST